MLIEDIISFYFLGLTLCSLIGLLFYGVLTYGEVDKKNKELQNEMFKEIIKVCKNYNDSRKDL